ASASRSRLRRRRTRLGDDLPRRRRRRPLRLPLLPHAEASVSGPGRCLAITDAVLFDGSITDAELVTLGLALDHPNRAPTKEDYKAALPVNDAQVSRARSTLAKKGLAYVNRGRVTATSNGHYRPPLRLERVAPHADPLHAGPRFTLVPTE